MHFSDLGRFGTFRANFPRFRKTFIDLGNIATIFIIKSKGRLAWLPTFPILPDSARFYLNFLDFTRYILYADKFWVVKPFKTGLKPLCFY